MDKDFELPLENYGLYKPTPQQGKKFDDNKSEWNLLYYPCLESLVRVMMLGKGKYGFENWKKPFDKKRLWNAGMRHMVSHLSGEYLDAESNEPHIIHTMANCMMLYFHELKDQCNDLGESYSVEEKVKLHKETLRRIFEADHG